MKKTKIKNFDYIFLGVGIVASYFIYQAITGKIGSGNSGSSGSGTVDNENIPAPFPTIVFPYAGSYNTVQKWAQAWQTYAISSCVTDCSWRYDILEQTQNKLSDSQIKQVSDAIKLLTGKNMYQQMQSMWWFGGPYSSNKAEELFDRIKTISL